MSGASPAGACRSDCATSFSSPFPASSMVISSTLVVFLVTVRGYDSSILMRAEFELRGLAQIPSRRKFAAHKFECSIARRQAALELRVFYGIQNLAKLRAGNMPGRDQIIPRHQRRGANLIRRNLGLLLANKFIRAQIAMAGQRVGAMQREMFVEARQAEKSLQRRFFHARGVAEAHVIVDERENLLRIVVRETQALADFLGHLTP